MATNHVTRYSEGHKLFSDAEKLLIETRTKLHHLFDAVTDQETKDALAELRMKMFEIDKLLGHDPKCRTVMP
jgi:hypothetical protein